MSVFIMRRGLALPKYVWNRYSIAYTETAGSSATVSRTYSYSKMAASAYTRSGTTFTLTSPTSTTFENISSGKYLVNVANSSSTATSGTTLYKVTNNAGRTKNLSTGSSVSTFTCNTQLNFYVYGHAYYNTNDKAIRLTNEESIYWEDVFSVKNVYIPPRTSLPTSSAIGNGYQQAYYITGISGPSSNFYSGPWTISYKTVTIATSSTLNLTYTPYTAKTSAGTLIDTVSDNDVSAYPTNGIQDGYWYILQS